MTKKNKPFFIFDRNDFINEDLRDDLPPYMQDQVKGTWGEEYLDLDASEKIPEIPDQRVKISWDDIGSKNDEVLMTLTGSVTEKLMDELTDDLKKIELALELYDNNVMIDKELHYTDSTVKGEFWELFSEMKRGKMFNSTESIEENLEYIIKLFYDNNIRSIDFNKTKFDPSDNILKFRTYENRTTNFTKHLNKLAKYTRQVLDGKKEIDVFDSDKQELEIQLRELDVAIKHVQNALKSGALKSIIMNVIDQVDEMRNGDIQPEILISSKPDDFLRMSVSPFYSSCQELYTGSHRRQLLSNVFDKNSMILYIIIDKPFKDCKGNEHPYTPILRSVIRKLDGDEYALDQIYKPESINITIDELQDLLNSKLDTMWFDDELWSQAYEVEYGVESEAIYKLPATYSDRFSVKGEGQLLERIHGLDESEAIEMVNDQTGYKPEKIMGDFIIFHKMPLEDTVHNLDPNPIKNLYDLFKGEDIDKQLELDEVFPLVQRYLSQNKEKAMELYEYLNNIMRDEILKFRESLGRRIDPQSDLLSFFETYNLDGNIRELERTVRREMEDTKMDKNKKRVIYKYIQYLIQYSDIGRLGAKLEVDWEGDDLLLFEGIDQDSVAILDGQYSDEEVISMLYDNGFIDQYEVENLDIDKNMKRGITDYLRTNYTSDLGFIEMLHMVAEEGLESEVFFDEVDKALTIFLR